MKLYFYILDRFKDLELKCIAVEAVERPRSYKLQKDAPGLYKIVINKDEIGITLGWHNDVVILTEQDTAKAKEIFINQTREEINKHRKEIERYEKEIDTINSL